MEQDVEFLKQGENKVQIIKEQIALLKLKKLGCLTIEGEECLEREIKRLEAEIEKLKGDGE